MYLQVLVIVGLLYVVKYVAKYHKYSEDKFLGRYSMPGISYWLKRLICYIFIKQHRKSFKHKKYFISSYVQKDPGKSPLQYDEYGFDPNMVESVQEIKRKHDVDSVYFTGFLEKKLTVTEDHYIIIKFTRRRNNTASIRFLLHLPHLGILMPTNYPDTTAEDLPCSGDKYIGDNFVIEMLDPMKKWRVSYNGLMKSLPNNNNENKSLLHVKFAFIWTAYSDPFDTLTDTCAKLLSDAFAKEPWSEEKLKSFTSSCPNSIRYNQWGQMKGQISVEGNVSSELIFRGIRDRRIGWQNLSKINRSFNFYGHFQNGMSVFFSTTSDQFFLTHKMTGYLNIMNGTIFRIQNCDFKLWEVGEDMEIPQNITFSFDAGGRPYTCVCMVRDRFAHIDGLRDESRVIDCICDVILNGFAGQAMCEFHYRQPMKKRKVTKVYKYKPMLFDNLCAETTLVFQDKYCINPNIVGGKGSQLAQLTAWTQNNNQKYSVASGFCITCRGYDRQLQQNKELSEAIKSLSGFSCETEIVEELKVHCEKVSEEFHKVELLCELKEEILKQFVELNWVEKLENGYHMTVKVAVRSSAIDEDTDDMSAAGQLDTVLGVSQLDQVYEAITKCWSGLYSFNAVQYRRQHGKSISSGMGVVIQEMVEKPVASGVIFTINPVTGHPAEIMINANYGLGESVVSGLAEPDNIIVTKNIDGKFIIKTKSIASKRCKVVTKDSGGIMEEHLTASECANCCLDDSLVLRLCEIAVEVENMYQSPRDIEWAITEDQTVYLFQSRPITVDSTETEYELLHEFDSASGHDKTILTTANISEMFSGAATPLSVSTFNPSVGHAVEAMAVDNGTLAYNAKHIQQAMLVTQNHLQLSYSQMFLMNKDATFLGNKHSLDVNVFGRPVNEICHEDVAPLHLNQANFFKKFQRSFITLKKLIFGSKEKFERLLKEGENLNFSGNNCEALYEQISKSLPLYVETWTEYTIQAAKSGFSWNLLAPVLVGGKEIITPELFPDMATILSTCTNIVSAEVPTRLSKIANCIAKDNEQKEKFLQMSPHDAISWLLQDKSDAGKMFQSFLQEHGHRALKEAELLEKSWSEDPYKLGSVLQTSVRANNSEKQIEFLSVNDTMSRLESPLSLVSRAILKYLIPRARKSVADREWGKSLVIKQADRFKQAYWKLAQLARKEGRIPDKELLFFLTHYEIGKLIYTRSTALLTRAIKRRRIYAKQMDLKFPEISFKMPALPENLQYNLSEMSTQGEIHGMAVSHGVVEGTVRVVKSLQDAVNIVPGDILIVHTTDVGWSPYFPIISGLVTEIGGLISHGAVVAREYGLPCIVSAVRGTDYFKSGDRALLDGGKGVIKKLL